MARRVAPINAAILAGDAVTGNSVITLADRMDAGRVLGQSDAHRTGTDRRRTARSARDRRARAVLRVIDEVSRGDCPGKEQDESQVTKASKLSRDDGWVDSASTAEPRRGRVHGLTPWPGVSVGIAGEQSVEKRSLKLLRVQAIERRSEEEPGTLIDAAAGTVAWRGGLWPSAARSAGPGKKAYELGRIPAGQTADWLNSPRAGSTRGAM